MVHRKPVSVILTVVLRCMFSLFFTIVVRRHKSSFSFSSHHVRRLAFNSPLRFFATFSSLHSHTTGTHTGLHTNKNIHIVLPCDGQSTFACSPSRVHQPDELITRPRCAPTKKWTPCKSQSPTKIVSANKIGFTLLLFDLVNLFPFPKVGVMEFLSKRQSQFQGVTVVMECCGPAIAPHRKRGSGVCVTTKWIVVMTVAKAVGNGRAEVSGAALRGTGGAS